MLSLTLGLAVAFSASAPAGAQSGSGSTNPPASTKSVKRFIEKQARIVAERQQPAFPNARIDGRETWARCVKSAARRWLCVWSAYIHERSTVDPPAKYDPEWPIRQGTLRTCSSPGKGAGSVLTIRQNGRTQYPRRLRVIGGWRLDCPLTEEAIEQWNKYGPDYQPNVPEPTPYEVIEPPKGFKPQQRDDLLRPPSGEPGGPPPGPISTHGGAGSSSTTARAATHIFEGCGPYVRHYGWLVYACYWGADVPPFGAGLGIFNQASYYYEWYYWAGKDSAGRAINRMFASGTWNP